MKRTISKTTHEPSSEEYELCTHCRGEGTNLKRGYQQSMDEAIAVTCQTCGGTGEQPAGTKAKEEAERKQTQIRWHLKQRDEAQAKLDKLGFYDL
jgi:DnaJ-class molecular chaperone